MKNFLCPHFFQKATLASVLILSGLMVSLPANASQKNHFICVAKIDCGAPTFPSTQDLPSDESLMVKSASREEARDQCMKSYSDSYFSLAKRVEKLAPADLLKQAHGCNVVSDAFPVDLGGKNARAPATKN